MSSNSVCNHTRDETEGDLQSQLSFTTTQLNGPIATVGHVITFSSKKPNKQGDFQAYISKGAIIIIIRLSMGISTHAIQIHSMLFHINPCKLS